MDGPPLDRPRADQGHFYHEVVERPRPQAGECRHLGPALDLENPYRIGPAQHLVHRRVLGQGRQVGSRPVKGPHVVHGGVQGGKHPQAQQVELHQAGPGTVVFVPLQDAAVGHARPLDGAHLGHGAVAYDHASGMDAEVAGKILDFSGQGQHRLRVCRRHCRYRPGGAGCRHCRPGAGRAVPGVYALDQASTWPCEAPRALPMSRTAERGR